MKPAITKPHLLLFATAGIVAFSLSAMFAWQAYPSLFAFAVNDQLTEAVPSETAVTEAELHARQQRWRDIIPIYQRYAQRQREVCDSNILELKAELAAVRDAIDTSRFAEEVMSLNTMGHTVGTIVDDVFSLDGENAFSDPEELNDFLKTTFFAHVVDVSDIDQLISSGIAAANSEFIQNSNQLLIDCNIDAPFDPGQLGLENTDLSDFKRELDRSLPSLESLLKNAFASNVLTTIGGIASGGAALKAAKGGNAHSMLASLTIGALGDMVGSHVTAELLATEETIMAESHDIAMQLMNTFLDDQQQTFTWTNAIEAQCDKHIDQCGKFLADHVKVSPSIPVDSLK